MPPPTDPPATPEQPLSDRFVITGATARFQAATDVRCPPAIPDYLEQVPEAL